MAEATPTGSHASGLDFAGHASEFWLAAHWKKPLAHGLDAALGFREAADLWAKAADRLEKTAGAESFRQRMNRIRAFIEAGDLPRAKQAETVARERLELLEKESPRLMKSVQTEWLELLDTLRSAHREFKNDMEAMKAEVARTGSGDLRRLSPDTSRRWLERYPGMATSHYMAYRVAEGREDWKTALAHLEDAITLEPAVESFHMLRLNLVPRVERDPERAWRLVDSEFRRIEHPSGTAWMIYALLSLGLRKAPGRDPRDGWDIAARSFSMAMERPTSEMSLALWGWASVLRQYCLWKLKTSGVASPFTYHPFVRGAEIFEIDLTSWSRRKNDDAVEAELRVRAERDMATSPAA